MTWRLALPRLPGDFPLKIIAKDEEGGIDALYGGTVKLEINYLSPSGEPMASPGMVFPDLLMGSWGLP